MPVCSPAHAVLNGAFVVLGAALVVGAVLLLLDWNRSRMLGVACSLWVISGLSLMATGLVPLDVDLELHALISTPAIVLQPVALALHAGVYARQDRRWFTLVGIAAVVVIVAVFFLLRLEVQWGGLLERVAIWPVLITIPLLASHHARAMRPSR